MTFDHTFIMCVLFGGGAGLREGGGGGDTGLRWSDDPHSLSNAIHVATATTDLISD